MAHRDTYASFRDLAKAEREGDDFDVIVRKGTSGLVVVAPHAGRIELYTSAIARAIAGPDLALYLFEGKKHADNRRLHITSEHFDEPRCLALVQASRMAIGVHGAAGAGEQVIVGGGNEHARTRMLAALEEFGATDQGPPHLLGRSHRNICNRAANPGVQLEISRGLRVRLAAHEPAVPTGQPNSLLARFAWCVRTALLEPGKTCLRFDEIVSHYWEGVARTIGSVTD